MGLFSGITRRQQMIVSDACRSGVEALVDPTRMDETGIRAHLRTLRRWPNRHLEMELVESPDSFSLNPGDRISVGFNYGSAMYRFSTEVVRRQGRTLTVRPPNDLQPTWSQRRPRVIVPDSWEVFCDIRGIVSWLKPHVASHIDDEDLPGAAAQSATLVLPVIEISDSGLAVKLAGVRRSFAPIVGEVAQDSLLRLQTASDDVLQIPCSLSVRSVLIEERRAYDDDLDVAPARMVRTAKLGLQFEKIAERDQERIAQFIALEAERQSES